MDNTRNSFAVKSSKTTSAAALDWREGDSSIEKAVRCCGCGSTISVAESRAATTPGGSAVFSCSPECECDYEQS